VQQIVKAYEAFSNGSAARPTTLRDLQGRPEDTRGTNAAAADIVVLPTTKVAN
jgi:hypothetical protein